MTERSLLSTPPLSEFARDLRPPRAFVGVLGTRQAEAADLLGGNPAEIALPRDAFAEAVNSLSSSSAAFRYSGPRGLPGLVDWLAEREGVDPSRIVVTNGALHALSIVALALVDPGEGVAVDDPVFPVYLRVLELARARPVPVAVDADGFGVERLEAELAAGRVPRLVYTVPDFQNPTGATLSAERRARLVELAERFGFVLISDNPYRISRWAGDEVPDVSVDSDRVVRVNTFSKSLGPGLRAGWLVLPEWLVPSALAIRSRTDQHPSTIVQAAIESIVTSEGVFDTVVQQLRDAHRSRAEALVGQLGDRLGARVEFEEPDGGFFLWARLTDPAVSVDELLTLSERRGTSFSRGSSFQVPGGADHSSSLRLGFSSVPEATIELAVSRIAEAYDELVSTGPR